MLLLCNQEGGNEERQTKAQDGYDDGKYAWEVVAREGKFEVKDVHGWAQRQFQIAL